MHSFVMPRSWKKQAYPTARAPRAKIELSKKQAYSATSVYRDRLSLEQRAFIWNRNDSEKGRKVAR